MVKMPRFETYCLETGVKALVTETGQQLPPSYEYQSMLPFFQKSQRLKDSD